MQAVQYFFIATACLMISSCAAQKQSQNTSIQEKSMTELPYDTIPAYPSEYTATAVVVRMIDGLGFRYRWATENLSDTDLAYRPDSTARTSLETMEHLLGLSSTIINAVTQQANIRPKPENNMTWPEMRLKTLTNLKEASTILRSSTDEDLKKYNIIFERGDKKSEFPFWHQLNGPIADALWHCGQIVTLRRASGNPIDNRVNVFMGKVRER